MRRALKWGFRLFFGFFLMVVLFVGCQVQYSLSTPIPDPATELEDFDPYDLPPDVDHDPCPSQAIC